VVGQTPLQAGARVGRQQQQRDDLDDLLDEGIDRVRRPATTSYSGCPVTPAKSRVHPYCTVIAATPQP
jgi:hypothetical protein